MIDVLLWRNLVKSLLHDVFQDLIGWWNAKEQLIDNCTKGIDVTFDRDLALFLVHVLIDEVLNFML